ncbi:SDR family oxidoreductase [Algoriphagus resistens]|uniref:SDR family oxidoreductase n=1 Tax=Algoriphagus resistens TaxID=1750590 RepID=UPI0007169EF8|nr:SDR family oxidoreductase [Algoriphagus resistens]
MNTLKNKVALITGASRGIGKAIALRYAKLGADIVVNYNSNSAAAESVVKEIESYNCKAIAVKADISKPEQINAMFGLAVSAFGKIDIVVVNAGLELVGIPVTGFSESQFDNLFNTNTKGAYFTMQAAARHIADKGRILYIGSSTVGFANPGYAIHGGSKIAPMYLVQVMAKELGMRGVTVNAILPTATEGAGIHTVVDADSPVRKMIPAFYPMGRMGTPEDVANVAEFFAGELSSFVSGQQLLVSGGAQA